MNQADRDAPQASIHDVFASPPLGSGAPDSGLSSAPSIALRLHYTVAMPHPETHLFEVTLRVDGWPYSTLDLKMPVWTPGSYLVREYSRHLQTFAASAPDDRPLRWQKVAKNHWQVATDRQSTLTVKYQIFANELTVRTNHLDLTHGFFNGAALFFYLPGWQQQPITVTIQPPPDWQVATALPPVAGQSHTFIAKDFDTLVDSPFEIGIHQTHAFEVLDKPHEFVIWGQGNLEIDRLLQDTQKIITVEANLFGGLPYDRYLFILHLAPQAFGGLEHKDSCTLIYDRLSFRGSGKYERFMQLVAHEFFHLWNVKRIRPQALEVFDYEGENYTPSLWFCEGTTSFYDLLIPFWAGIYDVRAYLGHLSQEITRYLTTPGRLVQPVSEASFDAWIKLYRPDANSANAQISYYLKGEMVSLLLDLAIRIKHANQRSLNDVMRHLWEQFGKAEIGFTPAQLKGVIEAIAGFDLTDFFARYIDGIEALPFDEYLAGFGLRLHANNEAADRPPWLGITLKTEQNRELVKFVEVHSPAQMAGIDPGDELLAIDGLRLAAHQLDERLKDYQPGDDVTLTLFHQDQIRTCQVTLAAPRANSYQIVPLEAASVTQQQNFMGWLGQPLSVLQG
jgi:predicted metalloprotease with PDZ domain